jgi:Domain of unknown function (DUF5658)
MGLLKASFLLFALNLLDGLLTIFWVRTGVATEANALMAGLLDIGDAPFLAVKILMGGLTVAVVALWGNRKVARYGLSLALGAYLGLMVIHGLTGLSAVGYGPEMVLQFFYGDLSLLANTASAATLI